GLALENFDGAGEFRDTEKGAKIDASGSLDGRDFTTVDGLAQALHDHPALTSCLVKRVFAYATGSSVGAENEDEIAYLNARFAADGYRVPALLRTIALSRAFSEVHEVQPPTKTADAASPGAAAT